MTHARVLVVSARAVGKRMIKVVSAFALLASTFACGLWESSANEPRDGVVVTRRALTISAPIDTFTLAGAAASKPRWGVTVIQRLNHRSSWLELNFTEPLHPAADRTPIRPASCRILADAYSCRESATATIANGRLVIAVRDPAMLALLFASRPTHVSVLSAHPLDLGRVAVRYGSPRLRAPSRAALAEYDRALEREWGPPTRELCASHDGSDPVWMQAGERTAAGVTESQVRNVDEVNSSAVGVRS